MPIVIQKLGVWSVCVTGCSIFTSGHFIDNIFTTKTYFIFTMGVLGSFLSKIFILSRPCQSTTTVFIIKLSCSLPSAVMSRSLGSLIWFSYL